MRIWALEIRFFFLFFATLLAKIHRGNDVQQHPKCLDENMLARQLKHLVKQTGMKWCLSFHSDKGELTWWIMCVCACVLCNLAEKTRSFGLRDRFDILGAGVDTRRTCCLSC